MVEPKLKEGHGAEHSKTPKKKAKRYHGFADRVKRIVGELGDTFSTMEAVHRLELDVEFMAKARQYFEVVKPKIKSNSYGMNTKFGSWIVKNVSTSLHNLKGDLITKLGTPVGLKTEWAKIKVLEHGALTPAEYESRLAERIRKIAMIPGPMIGGVRFETPSTVAPDLLLESEGQSAGALQSIEHDLDDLLDGLPNGQIVKPGDAPEVFERIGVLAGGALLLVGDQGGLWEAHQIGASTP